MPIISFAKDRSPIEVQEGANLMQSLLTAGVPVASSCNGDGICTKCRVEIIKGRENLPLPNEQEQAQKEIHDIPRSERLSCQVEVSGDITIDTTYW